MNTTNQTSNDKLFVARAIEATIHIGLVILLLFWCFKIGQPFIETIVWGIIIAVALHPSHDRLKSALGGRDRLSATLITILALIVVLVPSVIFSESLIDTVQEYSALLQAKTLSVRTVTIRERQILAGHPRAFVQILEPCVEQSWSCAEQNKPAT